LKIFFALEKSFDSNYDALLGSAPAVMASPGCDCAVLPVCNRGEISRLGNAEESQCAPAPNGGQGWRKGEDHHVKRGFLQSRIFNRTSIFLNRRYKVKFSIFPPVKAGALDRSSSTRYC
jgi:hypothetical protein